MQDKNFIISLPGLRRKSEMDPRYGTDRTYTEISKALYNACGAIYAAYDYIESHTDMDAECINLSIASTHAKMAFKNFLKKYGKEQNNG